jgi:hypothetical protein
MGTSVAAAPVVLADQARIDEAPATRVRKNSLP